MILYLDTSALVKLYVEESGRDAVEDAVQDAHIVAVSEIGYAEACSALARKEREGSLSADEFDNAIAQLRQDYQELYLSHPVTGDLVARAGQLARKHALRGYDAVHLATALVLRDEAREVVGSNQESVEAYSREHDDLNISLMTVDGSLMKAADGEGLAHSRQAFGEEQ